MAQPRSKPSTQEPESRESSIFDPPEYRILYSKDGTFEWDPPAGSKELAVALSYHFPLAKKLENKMRAATKKFLKQEAKKGGKNKLPVLGEETIEEMSPLDPPQSDITTSQVIPDTIDKPEETVEVTSVDQSPNNTRKNYKLNSSTTLVPSLSSDQFQHSLFSPFFTNSKGSLTPKAAPKSSVSKDSANSMLNHGDAQTAQQSLLRSIPPPTGLIAPSNPKGFGVFKWVSGMDSVAQVPKKQRKRKYSDDERKKVAANRGFACEEHQRRKVKCDPEICPRNKRRAQSPHTISNNTEIAQGPPASEDVPSKALPSVDSDNTPAPLQRGPEPFPEIVSCNHLYGCTQGCSLYLDIASTSPRLLSGIDSSAIGLLGIYPGSGVCEDSSYTYPSSVQCEYDGPGALTEVSAISGTSNIYDSSNKYYAPAPCATLTSHGTPTPYGTPLPDHTSMQYHLFGLDLSRKGDTLIQYGTSSQYGNSSIYGNSDTNYGSDLYSSSNAYASSNLHTGISGYGSVYGSMQAESDIPQNYTSFGDSRGDSYPTTSPEIPQYRVAKNRRTSLRSTSKPARSEISSPADSRPKKVSFNGNPRAEDSSVDYLTTRMVLASLWG